MVPMHVKTADGEELFVEEHQIEVYAHHLVMKNSHDTFYEVRGPKAVTQELADRVWDEFGVDVGDHDVEVIDSSDDDVTVL